MILSPPIASQWNPVLVLRRNVDSDLIFFLFFPPIARSERYHHLASDEDEETNDEESSLEIRQFASWSHRFSKVCGASRVLRGRRGGSPANGEKLSRVVPSAIRLPHSLVSAGLQQHGTPGHTFQPELLVRPQPQRGQRGPERRRRTQSFADAGRERRGGKECRSHGQVTTRVNVKDEAFILLVLPCRVLLLLFFAA